MNQPYVPGTLVELYEEQARLARKKNRRLRWTVVAYFVGFLALDIYLLWPEPEGESSR